MVQNRIENLDECSWLGQSVAGRINLMITQLMTTNALLQKDGELNTLRGEFSKLADDERTTVENVRQLYDEKLLPKLQALREAINRGQVRSLRQKEQGSIQKIPEPKTFDQALEIMMRVIEEEVLGDAKGSAIDEVVTGKLRVENFYLPFQKTVREGVFKLLQETEISSAEAEGQEADEVDVVIIPGNQEVIFEILSLTTREIKKQMKTGEIQEGIGKIILNVREDIKAFCGASGLGRAARVQSIARARIARIGEAQFLGADLQRTLEDVDDRHTREEIKHMVEEGRELPSIPGLSAMEELVVRMKTGWTIGGRKATPVFRTADPAIPETARIRMVLMEQKNLRETTGEEVGPPPKDPKKGGRSLRTVKNPDPPKTPTGK
jgi:hypothetical protein